MAKIIKEWKVCDTCNRPMMLQGNVYRCPKCGKIIMAKEE